MCDSGSPRVYSLPDTKPGSFPSDPLTRSSRWFGIAHDLAGSLAPLQISGRKRKALAELSSTTQVLARKTRKIKAQRPTRNPHQADAPTPDGTTVGVIPQNRAERPIHRDQRSEKNSHETHGASHREPVDRTTSSPTQPAVRRGLTCGRGPRFRGGRGPGREPRGWQPPTPGARSAPLPRNAAPDRPRRRPRKHQPVRRGTRTVCGG